MGNIGGNGFDIHVPLKMPHSPGVNSSARIKIISSKSRRASFLAGLIDSGSAPHSESRYCSIPSHWLCLGRHIPYRIYEKTLSGKLREFHEAGKVYPQLNTEKQAENGVSRRLYIEKKLCSELVYYLDDNLDEILSNPYAGSAEKAELFYYMTYRRLKNAFTQPGKMALVNMKQVIALMLEKILNDTKTLKEIFLLVQHNVCKDPLFPSYTFIHSLNVGILSTLFIMKVMTGLSNRTLEDVSLGYFFHNIGMMRIPLDVINQGAPLNSRSWSLVHQHPQWGYETMTKIKDMSPEMAHIIMEHHERPNGKGYPRSLKGEDIHFFVKVCAIMDAFDALTSRTVYRQAMTMVDALKQIKEKTPHEYDSRIFSRLILVLLDNELI
jgi:HD-GYP domain-containing protein (c-di-GMP phosphodiesterase class II)